jgi:outer membrane receptor protein involved in Fe transport
LVYDQEATVFQFNSSVDLALTEKYSLNTRVDFFHYKLSTQQEAWHRPTWIVQMNHRYSPFKKLNLQASLQLMGGLQARGFGAIDTNPVQAEVVKLPALVDLQFKADYAISSRLSIFAEGNNLLNKRNIRWMNYPVRGIQGLGGLSFKF